MRAAAILVPLAGVIPKVASFAERRSNSMARETGRHSDDMMPLAHVVLRGASPAVTAAPKPRFVGANLFAREDDSNTCGYLHSYDDPDSDVYPLTCDPAYICTNVGRMRDCCRSSRCASATFSTSCLDSTACPAAGPDPGTICCTDTDYPYCVSYLWSSSTDTDDIYTVLNCRINTSNRLATLEAQSTTPSPTTTTDPTSTFTITTSTSPAPNKGGGTPVGAIVGGVVGGVAAIGLAAIAILLIVRKRKREESEASAPPPPQPNNQGSPPPMQQQQLPYNPHQSYQSSQQPFNTHQSFYGHMPASPDPTSIYPSPTQSQGPFQAYNPANGPATSPGPYSIQPTPPGFMAQTYNEPGKTGPDVHPMNTDPTPSPGVPSSTSPGATGGFQPPQNVHTVQLPGQYVEAPAINPVGSTGNRAELG